MSAFFSSLTTRISQYLDFYMVFFADQWHHMTPIKYGILLTVISLIGYGLMGRGNRRLG